MSTYYIETLPNGGEKTYDLYSRLLRERIIFLVGEIDSNLANSVIAQMFLLKNESKDPITMYINSQGGSAYAGLAIYDVMQSLGLKVNTVCYGYACSMASVILCSGSYGFRSLLPHSTVMIHQPLGRISGQASDMRLHTDEIFRIKKIISDIYLKHTKISDGELEKLLDRDTFLSPSFAKKYGVIDNICL